MLIYMGMVALREAERREERQGGRRAVQSDQSAALQCCQMLQRPMASLPPPRQMRRILILNADFIGHLPAQYPYKMSRCERTH